jgi:hypothetical protein
MHMLKFLAAILLNTLPAFAAPPRDAMTLDAAEWPRDYRLHLQWETPAGATLRFGAGAVVNLTPAAAHDIAVEFPEGRPPLLRVWNDSALVRGPEDAPGLADTGAAVLPDARIDFGADLTLSVEFHARGHGALVSKCAPTGDWTPDAKALFLRDGKLVFDIGWLGELKGGRRVNNGQPRHVVLSLREDEASMWLDDRRIARSTGFSKPDVDGHVFKIGRAAANFAGDLADGAVTRVRAWGRALTDEEIRGLFKDGGASANTPDFYRETPHADPRPVIEPAPGAKLREAWVQPLERSDHAEIVRAWDETSLEEGRVIYAGLCVTCHGTIEAPGALPTSLRFAEGVFKNGADPYSMHTTLTRGYNLMVPQPQYTTRQKYAVIQYIRETFVRGRNPSQWTEITPELLTALPRGLAAGQAEAEDRSAPRYEQMDIGPALFWTYEIAPGNFARKGVAIRLDEGPGGVSKGQAWMVYDHDEMRLAAATTGGFVDWRDIAFDGSHGTHVSLVGERHAVLPRAPGWASQEGSWADPRPLGRDGEPYGPLPASWARYDGLYLHNQTAVLAFTIHGVRVLESPGWIDYGATPVFTRTIQIAATERTFDLRVAPDTLGVALIGDGTLSKKDGFWVARLPGGAHTRLFLSRTDAASLDTLARGHTGVIDLEALTRGGPARSPQVIRTTSVAGPDEGAFAADTYPLPLENPWHSWLRPGGFDFTPDGRAAVVAMWNGDVWRVDGILAAAPAELTWRRIATGLYQPLGVRFRGDDLFVLCRDQLARLRDLNADGETDLVECFNNDHQVTPHFHEFAMGLQTDPAGNFYYAKSARHELEAVVPHHGTLLRVAADGSRTDILANGFRAANGVCVNDDGTFFLTDQEGYWTPKNRINRVHPGGFYGNMTGYSDVTDPSDSAMEQPVVWITNHKDRSPAELVWVPKDAWGGLGGALLNLSYGTGRAFIVPHAECNGAWQGAVCELPLPAFPTGIMRGRFGADGALYACGMFAWAGNATEPGGFHRIRNTGRPAHLPLRIDASPGRLRVTFSDDLAPGVEAGDFKFTTWSLRRTARYGSDHHGTKRLPIEAVRLSTDLRTVELDIPALAPTQCYELIARLKTSGGAVVERNLHGTLHHLQAP